MQNKTIFSVRPSLLPFFLSFDNIVMILFLGIVFAFRTYFRIGFIETVIIFVIIIVLLFPVIIKIVMYLFTTYTLTEKELTIKTKLIFNSRKTINTQDIQWIKCKQSLIMKSLGLGNIIIKSSSTNKTTQLANIQHFQMRKQQIEDIVKK